MSGLRNDPSSGRDPVSNLPVFARYSFTDPGMRPLSSLRWEVVGSGALLIDSIVAGRIVGGHVVGGHVHQRRVHARVAANAIDLVRRQILTGEHLEQASHERLRALLGHDGPPEALERALCERIRDRSLDASTPGLLDHLMACTLAKMSIDQPSYASYRRALEEHPGHAPI